MNDATRVLIRLEALNNAVYIQDYHKLQGFVYRLLGDASLFSVHENPGCKFLSFSNLLPPRDISAGEERYLFISSPNRSLIATLGSKLEEEKGKTVHIGEMAFKIAGIKMFRPRIDRRGTLRAVTPIVVRIPAKNYAVYGISSKWRYTYWRKGLPLSIFVKQLEENLIKKYNRYYGASWSGDRIFDQFVFEKQVCVPATFKGRQAKIIGSLWSFPLESVDEHAFAILQFGLESGLGEMNSLGFGFIEVVRKQKRFGKTVLKNRN